MQIMIDLETLGAKDNARILQISAVAFELNGGVQEVHELLRDKDRWFDASVCYPIPDPWPSFDDPNVNFWSDPAQARARELIDRRAQEPIRQALGGFAFFVSRWLGKRGSVWAKPPQFDLRILRAQFGFYSELSCPWSPGQERDLGTLIWAAKKTPRTNFRMPDTSGAGLVEHFALHDAARQAVVAQAAYRSLLLHLGTNHDAG